VPLSAAIGGAAGKRLTRVPTRLPAYWKANFLRRLKEGAIDVLVEFAATCPCRIHKSVSSRCMGKRRGCPRRRRRSRIVTTSGTVSC
jgi:hypothetical protein